MEAAAASATQLAQQVYDSVLGAGVASSSPSSVMLLLPPPLEAVNALVDAIVPVYTMAVLYLLVAVHRQQRRLSSGLPPADAAAEEAALWAFEREVVAARKAEKARAVERQRRERQAQQQQKQQQQAAADMHPLSEGVVAAGGAQRRNFSGVWRSIPAKNVNYDEFLTVQGVPYLKRKIATTTVVTHTIEHEGDLLKLEVQPLNMKTTFNIGGAPTVSYIGKKAFEDKMTWNAQGELVLVKTNAEDGTEITAVRALSEDGRLLVMKQCVKNLKDGKETHAEQTFEKS